MKKHFNKAIFGKNPIMEDIIPRKHPVDKLMKKFGVYQNALAEIIGVDKATLWRWKDQQKDIPAQHHPALLKRAKNKKIKLPKNIFYV